MRGISEVKITLKRLSVYLFLMLLIVLPVSNIIPGAFPTRHLSSLILFAYSVCLFMYYDNHVSKWGNVKKLMLWIAAMITLLFLLRAIKYSAFTEIDILARHAWYLYYFPMLLIPQLFFFTALSIHAYNSKQLIKKWMLTMVITLLFITLVLTNDFHQSVFSFEPNFAAWDSDYSHGLLFYILTFWQYLLYVISIAILLYKCRHTAA